MTSWLDCDLPSCDMLSTSYTALTWECVCVRERDGERSEQEGTRRIKRNVSSSCPVCPSSNITVMVAATCCFLRVWPGPVRSVFVACVILSSASTNLPIICCSDPRFGPNTIETNQNRIQAFSSMEKPRRHRSCSNVEGDAMTFGWSIGTARRRRSQTGRQASERKQRSKATATLRPVHRRRRKSFERHTCTGLMV